MGASRILSAKKHSGKVSKYSALLYASSAHASFPHPSFRDPVYCHKAGFLSSLEPLGCGRLFFIRCCAVCFGCLRKRRWKFAPFSGYRMKNKFCFQDQLLCASRVRHATTPGPIMLRKPALFQRMLSRKEKGASQDIDLEGV